MEVWIMDVAATDAHFIYFLLFCIFIVRKIEKYCCLNLNTIMRNIRDITGNAFKLL